MGATGLESRSYLAVIGLIAIPPRAIAFNVDNVSRPTIDRRLPKLEDAGLVERYTDPQGYTRITNRGRAYLVGELDASDLEDE